MKKICVIIGMLFTTAAFCDLGTKYLHNYMMANYHQFGGQMKSAYEIYKDILAVTPSQTVAQSDAPLHAYRGYIHLLFETGNYAHIVQLIPVIDKLLTKIPQADKQAPLFKDAQDIQLIFAQALDKVGQYTQSDDRFIRLNDQFKTNPEIAFNTVNAYMRRQEPKNGLVVLDNFLNAAPRKTNNFIFYFMKAQICMQMGDKKAALDSVQKALEMHPRFDKGWLLYALLQEQAGQLQSAIKGYTTFLEVTNGAHKDVEQHLLQLAFKQKLKDTSSQSSLVVNKPCFDKALSLFEQKNYTQALKQIDVCLAERPLDDESKLLKIQILSALNQTDKAAGLLKDWLIQDPGNNVWFKTLHLLTRTNLNANTAITVLHAVAKAHPKQLMPHLYLADLYTRADKPTQAIEHHKQALELNSDNALKEKILLQLGILYYDAKDIHGVKHVVEQCKKITLQHIPLMNLVAYYYATDGDNVQEAEKLMATVLKKFPDNPHFLDTQAMVHSKKKEHVQALNILEKIAKSAPNDYTILVHLAKARHEHGDMKGAINGITLAQQRAKTPCDKKECEKLLAQWQHPKKIQANIIASAL